jgi:hypothetical protein
MPKEPMAPGKFNEELGKIRTQPPAGIDNKPHE